MTEFISRLESMLDLKAGSLSSDIVLTTLSSWDSMAVVEFMAFVDEEYNKILDIENIAECKTVSDLYKLIRE